MYRLMHLRSTQRFARYSPHHLPHVLLLLQIMAVSVRGRVHKLRVRPGPDGKEDFKRQVRQLLGYSDDMEFDVIFECKTPHNGR